MLPNARDAHGRTPLIHAARSPGPATAAIMRTLLRSGADIDWQDMFGRSALHETVLQRGRLVVSDGVHAAEAASSDHDSNVDVDETTSILLFLLHRDANPDLQDANGDTPLHYAARYAAISDARALLRAHASSTLLNRNGHAPLHVAEIHAHNTTVVRFLALGMDVNIVTSTGATVLHFAIWEGRVAMALTLMRLGARVDACDIAGMTPLHVAAAATFPASTEILDELLRRGADVQAVDRHARTPLIQAVMVGNVRAVHTLLAARGGVAVVNKADWLGRTALHHAAVGGSVLMVEVLLVHGADPGVCDSRGQRAVDLLPRRSNTTASDRAATRLRSLLRVNSIPITTSSNGSLPPPLTLTSPPRKLHRTIAHRILSADTHCSVCMDPLYTHDAAVPDGCARHVFHRRCLMRWYEQVARANVDANAGADDGGRRRRVMAPCPGCRTPFGKAYVITM